MAKNPAKSITLNAPEGELSEFIESLPDAVIITGERGDITAVNAAVEEVFGYTSTTLCGRNLGVLLPYVARRSPFDRLLNVSRAPRSQTTQPGFQSTGKRKDGTTFPVRVSLRPLSLGDSRLVTTVVRDVSEQEELQRTALRLQSMIESSDDAISSCTMDGTVTEWNSGAEKIYGYSAAEVKGRKASLFAPEDLRTETVDLLERVKRGEHVVQHQTRRVRKDGHEIWVSLSISPVKDEDGVCQGVTVTAREITEQRRLQAQLLQAQKMEAVGQLTGGIAHDFNNLLTVIIMNLQMMSRRASDQAPLLELIETASRSARQGSELTRRLLAFAKRQSLEPAVVDVNGRLAETEALLGRTLGEQITLRTSFAPDVWTVRVDAAQLESSLLNLALNARDAMPGGGRLTVETSNVRLDKEYLSRHAYAYPGPYVMIAVSDTGSGISEEALERVFDAFFTTKPAGEGSGLGLSMVYGFIRQSGGYIDIYSEVGRGTTVKLYLPKFDGEAASVVEKPGEELPGGNETLLLVDDNSEVRRTIAMFLRELGYAVLEADSARSAFEIIERESGIALLLTDVVMPGQMDGLKLAEKVLSLRPEIKVLCTSGYTEYALDPERFKKKGTFLLSKPYEDHDLAQKLRNLLDGRAV